MTAYHDGLRQLEIDLALSCRNHLERKSLKIQRVDARDGSTAVIDQLREKLSPAGDVVSPRGKALTEEVFGKALTPNQVVATICEDVRREGTPALLRYGAALDKAELSQEELRVPAAALAAAHAKADPQLIESIRRIRDNVAEFQTAILHQDVSVEPQPGVKLWQRYLPLRRVGVCVPGGAAAYPSTVLMTAVPAQVAGVKEIALVAPPTPFGAYNTEMLATCYELGLTEVYRIGGAQAVAALAYGCDAVPRVDKIVGPGNLFVALAKKHVFGTVDIDSFAGPQRGDRDRRRHGQAQLRGGGPARPGGAFTRIGDLDQLGAVTLAGRCRSTRLPGGFAGAQ